MTGGDIVKVKPTEILNQFSNLLTTEVIATNVKISVKLHKTMSFRNESTHTLKYDGSTLIKEIGNATTESELYVEYQFKPSEEIVKKFPEIDLEKLEHIPFQSVVEYTSKAGDKCIRVMTNLQKLSSDKEEIAKDAKYNILSVNAMQKSSQLAKEGNYRKAQANAYAWKNMMKGYGNSNKEADDNYMNFNRQMKEFNHHMQEQQYCEVANSSNQYSNYDDLQAENETSRKVNRTDKVSKALYSLSNMNQKKAFK